MASRSKLVLWRRQRAPRRPLFIALCLAATLPCAFPSLAAADPGETASEKETARSLMDIGNAKLEAGDVAGALDAFRGAHRIMGVPTTGLAVARAYVRLGKLVEATDAIGEIRRFPAQPKEPKAFVVARQEAETLDASLAKRIPIVRIQTHGPGAHEVELFIDGTSFQQEAVHQPHRVNPGRHVVRAAAPGYLPAEETITLAEADDTTIELTLAIDPEAPTLSEAPPSGPQGDTEAALAISPLTYSAFAVGGASVLLGAATGIASLVMTANLEDQCQNRVCPADLEGDHDTIIALANTSNITLALGAVGVGIGVVSLIFDLDSGEPATDEQATAASNFTLEPLVGVGSLGVKGTF